MILIPAWNLQLLLHRTREETPIYLITTENIVEKNEIDIKDIFTHHKAEEQLKLVVAVKIVMMCDMNEKEGGLKKNLILSCSRKHPRKSLFHEVTGLGKIYLTRNYSLYLEYAKNEDDSIPWK